MHKDGHFHGDGHDHDLKRDEKHFQGDGHDHKNGHELKKDEIQDQPGVDARVWYFIGRISKLPGKKLYLASDFDFKNRDF